MSILSDIFHKIFPASHPAETRTVNSTAPQPPLVNVNPTATNASIPYMTEVDVEAILDVKAQTAGQTLNWRNSIVDLLKLLDLDSSLQSRKALAAELAFKGDTNDSASMNIWLHRQVMNKLAANGGKVPADLKD